VPASANQEDIMQGLTMQEMEAVRGGMSQFDREVLAVIRLLK
jgi:hypothetical protein